MWQVLEESKDPVPGLRITSAEGRETNHKTLSSCAGRVSGLCLGTRPSQQLCAGIAAYGQTWVIFPSLILLARLHPAWAGPPRLQMHLELAVEMYPAGPPSSTATSPQLCLWLERRKKSFCGRRALQRESKAQKVVLNVLCSCLWYPCSSLPAVNASSGNCCGHSWLCCL